MRRPTTSPVVPHGSGPYSYHFIASQTGPAFCEYVAASPDGRTIRPVFGDLFVGEPLPERGGSRSPTRPASGWNCATARCSCRSPERTLGQAGTGEARAFFKPKFGRDALRVPEKLRARRRTFQSGGGPSCLPMNGGQRPSAVLIWFRTSASSAGVSEACVSTFRSPVAASALSPAVPSAVIRLSRLYVAGSSSVASKP